MKGAQFLAFWRVCAKLWPVSAVLIAAVKDAAGLRFAMSIEGMHGLPHWERVRENGAHLVIYSGGDPLVVELFAYLHDCCRESDGADREHGKRAAQFAQSLRSGILKITDDQFELLSIACEHHDRGRVTDDATVSACWDADRLDLGRVGILPKRKYLSTAQAKRQAGIDWGYQRSCGSHAELDP